MRRESIQRVHLVMGSTIGACILGVLFASATMLDDLIFFFNQFQVIDIAINLLYLIITCIGFSYFFILPGLPILYRKNISISLESLSVLLFSILYSFCSVYFGLLILMLIGYINFILLVPLVMLPFSFFLRSYIDFDNGNDTEKICSQIRDYMLQKQNVSVLVIILLTTFIIRFVTMSTLVVEYTDGLQYHMIIRDIAIDNFIFNTEHATWAPLYPLLGYALSEFGGNTLFALKSLSFVASFVILLPIGILILHIMQEREFTPKVFFAIILAICAYPWLNIASMVNLQDILLTFFVASFMALIFSENQVLQAGAGIAAGLAFLTRYSLGILGPLGLAYLAIMVIRYRRLTWRGAGAFFISWLSFVIPWVLRNLFVAGILLSRSDEGLIDTENIVPNVGLINEFGLQSLLNPFGIFSIIIAIPLGIGVLMMFMKPRNQWFEFLTNIFSHKLVFVYIISILQIIVLLLFATPQMRFLLSIIWLVPIVWFFLIYLVDMERIHIILAGWIFWGFFYSLYLIRTYGYLVNSRFPYQDWEWSYQVYLLRVPSLETLILSMLCLVLIFFVTLLLHIMRADRTLTPAC